MSEAAAPTLRQHAVGARIELANFRSERDAALAALTEVQAYEGGRLRIDLGGVEAASSLLLALLIGLLREAAAVAVTVEFARVPATVITMIEFSGLEGVLPLLSVEEPQP